LVESYRKRLKNWRLTIMDELLHVRHGDISQLNFLIIPARLIAN
jgi:hypothetical protein